MGSKFDNFEKIKLEFYDELENLKFDQNSKSSQVNREFLDETQLNLSKKMNRFRRQTANSNSSQNESQNTSLSTSHKNDTALMSFTSSPKTKPEDNSFFLILIIAAIICGIIFSVFGLLSCMDKPGKLTGSKTSTAKKKEKLLAASSVQSGMDVKGLIIAESICNNSLN